MIYKLKIQYDGTDFHGWQIQDGLRTVQGELTNALSLLEGRRVIVHGAGRTDAGVHASGQVASVSLQRAFSPEELRRAINGNTGRDLRVFESSVENEDFHARFVARGKTYRYRIFNAPVMSPFWLRYAHFESRVLDVDLMRQAGALFLGEHDWTAFSSIHTDVSSRVRRINRLEINELKDEQLAGRLIEIWISADGFLRYMARSIAGTLLAAGRGEISADEVEHAIELGDKNSVGATAPPHGLTLVEVHY